MRKVHVNAGAGYDVHIGKGVLDNAGEIAAGVHKLCRIAVVADERVWNMYGGRLEESLKNLA